MNYVGGMCRADLTPLERPAPGSPRVNVQESAARYAFAAPRVRSLSVLDVASGSGLGADFLLAEGARLVIGAERSAAALRCARAYSAAPGPYFVRADALVLPFRDAAFDAVVSFETIEHLRDARGLLAEYRRILRRSGCLYLSTPNRALTRWLPPNPFHVREFTPAEIMELVGQHFATVTCFWQRPVLFPLFVLRQVGRWWLTVLPGGQGIWRLWQRMRPRRTRLAATTWEGEHFDQALLQDAYYSVVPARRSGWVHPTYTVLVATC